MNPLDCRVLAAALLTLDLGSKLEGLDTRKRLSPLGCTMLISLFSYIKVPSLNESSFGKRIGEGGGVRFLCTF